MAIGSWKQKSLIDEIKEKQSRDPWGASQNRLTSNDEITNLCIEIAKKIEEIIVNFEKVLKNNPKTTEDLKYLNKKSEELKKIIQDPKLPNPKLEKATMILDSTLHKARMFLNIYDAQIVEGGLYCSNNSNPLFTKTNIGLPIDSNGNEEDIIDLVDIIPDEPESTMGISVENIGVDDKDCRILKNMGLKTEEI